MFSNKMTQSWGLDYEWNHRNQKSWKVQVYRKEPHQIEGKRFQSQGEARQAAYEAGLEREGEIQ